MIWRTNTAAGLRLPESDAELVIQTERQGPETGLLVNSADEAARLITQLKRDKRELEARLEEAARARAEAVRRIDDLLDKIDSLL